MKKKILLLTLSVLLTITFSGCWDYTEYEKIARITAVGVDYNKDTKKITLTLQYVSFAEGGKSSGKDSSNSGSSSKGVVVSATDKTFYGALSRLQQTIIKKIYYGYLRVFIISEATAKYNMLDMVEFFNRVPSIRNSVDIIITAGKAQDVLSILDPSDIEPIGSQIEKQINATGSTGAAFPVSIQDFVAMLSISGLEATAPRLISTKTNSEGADATGGSYDGMKMDLEKSADILVSGIAAFKKDKFIGWLNEKESTGFGWITGKNISSFKASDASKGSVTGDILYYRINSSKSKIKVVFENNKPVIHVDIKVLGDLRKYYSGKGKEFIDGIEISHIEDELSKCVRSDVDAALKRGQKELKSDIFGFGFEFFRKYPKLWRDEYEKKWSELFPEIPVYVTVKSKVFNTGTNIKKVIIK